MSEQKHKVHYVGCLLIRVNDPNDEYREVYFLYTPLREIINPNATTRWERYIPKDSPLPEGCLEFPGKRIVTCFVEMLGPCSDLEYYRRILESTEKTILEEVVIWGEIPEFAIGEKY